MIIINIVLTLQVLTACLSHDRYLHEIKVVYDHTHIVSYRHLSVGNVGGEYGYWLLEGNEYSTAGGFSSDPFLSGSAPNRKLLFFLTKSSWPHLFNEDTWGEQLLYKF